MKKLFIMAVFCAMANFAKSQNTFPSSGNVGIGQGTPGFPLEINGAGQPIGSTGSINFGLLQDHTNYRGIYLGYDTSGQIGAIAGASGGNNSNIAFWNLYSGVWSEKMRITSNGNVGIGTPSPSNILSVNGSNDWVLLNRPSTSNYFGLTYSTANVNKWFTGLREGGTDRFSIFNFTNVTEPFSILENGNVGIGTDAPQSMLQVDDGCTKTSIGDASGSGLNYGTSYLGFNATRNSSNTWNIGNDSQHNGGGVIYSNIMGDIYFAPISSTGTTDQTLADADIKNKITFRVAADGITYAKQVKVQLTGWPDYVFNTTYSLRPLSQVKTYIDQHHHLPDMPSANEVERDGLNLGDMNKRLTKKVEELTLYLIEKDKENASLQDQLNQLRNEVKKELGDLKEEIGKSKNK